MPAPVVVLTPNIAGRDGISRLARLVADTFADASVLALHEPADSARVGRVRAVRAVVGRHRPSMDGVEALFDADQ